MTNSDGIIAAEYSVRAQFDDLCRRLAEEQVKHQLDRPLGYWALAGDRRLPYALLDQRVREIIQTPFAELSRTPGIGKKKLASLVTLLERVVRDRTDTTIVTDSNASSRLPDSFSLEAVAESHWELWRQTVRTHQLSQTPLGRFAPSLQAIPSVIWNAPLATYLDTTLADMRDMKAHGDKRLRAVVEVFYYIHRVVGQCGSARHLNVALRPAFAVAIEQWLWETFARDELPDLQDLIQNLVLPLLNQIETDGGEVVGRLTTGRIGVESPPESVIDQAERIQVTRARVYQLLEVCADIMTVRWPEGRWFLTMLASRLEGVDQLERRREIVHTLQSLLFPTRLRAPIRTEEPALAGANAVVGHSSEEAEHVSAQMS
jgi:hypothetical protein